MAKKKLKKVILIVFITLLIFLGSVIIFISPIVKYLVEKYDEKYTGRQIKMDWAYVNPFTGYLHFNNLKVFELKSDSVFLSMNGLTARVALLKMFSKTYEIDELILDKPIGVIIQKGNKHDLNFNDIIDRFSPKKTDTITSPVHFNILNIKINDGEFHYHENTIPVNYFIKKVNLESNGIYWNSDTIAVKFSFLSGIGKGDMAGNFIINTNKLDYSLVAGVHKFDLDFIEQYLKDFSDYGSFTANMDADVKATGNLLHARALEANGHMVINDFHFGKTSTEDYASFKKFTLNIIALSPEKHKYIFDSVLVNKPFFKYELYDHLDNIQTMFGKGGENVRAVHENPEHFNLILEIADYIKELSKDFFQSYYKIKRLEISNGDFKYNDFSLSEKFSAEINPFEVKADSIDKDRSRVKLFFRSGIKPYGETTVYLSINPKDSADFDLHFHLEKVPLSLFNPYLITYTSFPLDRGSLEFNAKWSVRNGKIHSENHLIIIDPRTTKRLKNKDATWIPVPLIMAFVRERGNVIDYEIPITGNLNNPKFHLKDVILDLLKNIFVKPPTMPYMVHVQTIERKIEKSQVLLWEMMQHKLSLRQEEFVHKIAQFLYKTPQSYISVFPIQYAEKEKEYILFFEAKKKYFLLKKNRKNMSLDEKDSLEISKMSIKDSAFVKYLDQHLNTKLIFTIQDKCKLFVNSGVINNEFSRLVKQRDEEFISLFKENNTADRVKIHSSKNEIPYNGFSYFKISYENEIPEPLIKAYEEIDKINEEPPRNKYFKLRKKIKQIFNN